jgi:hypothetical protein
MVTSELGRLFGGVRATQRIRKSGVLAKQFLEMMQFISNRHHAAIHTIADREMTGCHNLSFIE